MLSGSRCNKRKLVYSRFFTEINIEFPQQKDENYSVRD